MKRAFYIMVIALLACAWLSIIPAHAVIAPNPETFETYSLGGWTPTFAVEGWQMSGGIASEARIMASPGLTGQAMRVGYIEMSRMSSLDKTVYPQQTYSVDFYLQNPGNNYSRYIFNVEDGSGSPIKYATEIDILFDKVPKRATFYNSPGWTGQTQLPGWDTMTLNAWYTMQVEFDWTINKMRARFGPTGGAMNAWTDWKPVVDICQPDRETYSGVGGAESYVIVDNANLIVGSAPGPGNLDVNVTLDDYTGSFGLFSVKIDLLQGGSVKVTRTVVPTSSTFTESFQVISGSYTVSVQAPQWLAKSVPATVVVGQTVDADVTLANGDVDGDNAITTTDMSVVLANTGISGN